MDLLKEKPPAFLILFQFQFWYIRIIRRSGIIITFTI